MQIKKNKVITVDGVKFLVFDNLVINGRNFLYASAVSDDEEEISASIQVLEEVHKDGMLFVRNVLDQSILVDIIPKFIERINQGAVYEK